MNKFLPVLALFVLASCVTSGEQSWHKVNVKADDYLIANGNCKEKSYKAIPYTPPQNNCGVTVNVSGGATSDSTGVGVGVGTGSCQNQTSRAEWKIEKARKDVYEGCMLKNGWRKNAN